MQLKWYPEVIGEEHWQDEPTMGEKQDIWKIYSLRMTPSSDHPSLGNGAFACTGVYYNLPLLQILWVPPTKPLSLTTRGQPRARNRPQSQAPFGPPGPALPGLELSQPQPSESAVACGIPLLFVRVAAWSWDRSQADHIIPSSSFVKSENPSPEESCSEGSGRVRVVGAYEKADSWSWFWGGGLALRIYNGLTLVLMQALQDHTMAECLKLLFWPKLSLHGAFAPHIMSRTPGARGPGPHSLPPRGCSHHTCWALAQQQWCSYSWDINKHPRREEGSRRRRATGTAQCQRKTAASPPHPPQMPCVSLIPSDYFWALASLFYPLWRASLLLTAQQKHPGFRGSQARVLRTMLVALHWC